jgi:DNA-binding MarR family transcriptional regulator
MSENEAALDSVQEWTRMFFRNSMHHFMASAKSQGLSIPQIGALFQIHKQSKTGISHLSGELGVTSAAASQMLDKLVQLGLVARTEDERDRRAKRIALTEKGREALKASVDARQEWIALVFARLNDQEKLKVCEAFALMVEKAKEIEGEKVCCDSRNI